MATQVLQTPRFQKQTRNGRSMVDCKRDFLLAIKEGHTIAYSAAQAGVDRKTVYNWKDEDGEFAKAWADAYENGSDVFEEHLYSRALGTDTTAMIIALKIRKRFVEYDRGDSLPPGPPVQILIQINGQQIDIGEYRRAVLGLAAPKPDEKAALPQRTDEGNA